MRITLQRSKSASGIAYHRAGCGRPVVLIHGVGLRAESWFQQINAFTPSYRVFAIDLAGHGESLGFGVALPDLSDFSNRLKAFIDEVVHEPVIIVGHSLGALVAIDFAGRFGALCRGVASLNAIYRRTNAASVSVQERARKLRARTTGDVASAPLRRWFGEAPTGDDRNMAELCKHWLMQADPNGYAAAYTVFANEDGPSDDVLAALSMPALFLTGENDDNSSPQMSRAMAELTPNGDAVIIKNGRHLVQLTDSDEVNAALLRFIEDCDVVTTKQNVAAEN